MLTVLYSARMMQVRWLPALILALLLQLTSATAISSPVATPHVSGHMAPLMAIGPLGNRGGVIAPC